MEITDRLFSIKPFESSPAEKVRCDYSCYMHNGTVAMRLFCTDRRIPENADLTRQYCIPYATVTVNLDVSSLLPYDHQFIDENNLPGIGKWLSDNGIAQPTGIIAPSGYCIYEAYRFNVPEKTLKEVAEHRRQCRTNPPNIAHADLIRNQNTPKPKK